MVAASAAARVPPAAATSLHQRDDAGRWRLAGAMSSARTWCRAGDDAHGCPLGCAVAAPAAVYRGRSPLRRGSSMRRLGLRRTGGERGAEAEQNREGEGEPMRVSSRRKTGRAGSRWRGHGLPCGLFSCWKTSKGRGDEMHATHGEKKREEQGGKIRAKWVF
jgi:hypothetical protein